MLWRAFQAVLEQAGQSDEHGSESLAALVQRGNEEEKAGLHEVFLHVSNIMYIIIYNYIYHINVYHINAHVDSARRGWKVSSEIRSAASRRQAERLTRELRASKDELQRVKEDEMRMRNECEKYKTDFESTEKRYEVELKKRGDAEVKYLDKVRECEALQAGNLNGLKSKA